MDGTVITIALNREEQQKFQAMLRDSGFKYPTQLIRSKLGFKSKMTHTQEILADDIGDMDSMYKMGYAISRLMQYQLYTQQMLKRLSLKVQALYMDSNSVLVDPQASTNPLAGFMKNGK